MQQPSATRVYEKMMEHMQEQETTTRGLKKVIFDWAKKKGRKGSQKMMKSQSKPRGWGVANQLVFKKVRETLGFERCEIFVLGADTVCREVHDYFMSIKIQLIELYGQIESSGCLTLNLMRHHGGWKVGSCGKPINGVQLKISNPDEKGEGEICIKGRNVFMGYLNNEEETRKAIDSDGWLHSGDIGKVQDGFLYVTGRIKELIIMSDGENIPPVPIENRIKNEIPFLSHVMVVGDQRNFLACLMTLKCEMNPKTREFLDTLTLQAQQMIQALGSCNTNVSEILLKEDRAVFSAIQEGLDKANEHATSRAQMVKKWTLLNRDFSISGGELGPTLKVRRHVVHKKYAATIETMYSDLHQKDIVKQIYEKEMRYGHINNFIAKVLLFGIAGSGKTSVTAILMGDPPPPIRNSTPLMARPVQVTTILTDNKLEWVKKSPEEVREIIAKIIRSRESQEGSQENDSESQESDSESQGSDSESQETDLESRETDSESQETNSGSQEIDSQLQERNPESQETNPESQETNPESQERYLESQETDSGSRAKYSKSQENDSHNQQPRSSKKLDFDSILELVVKEDEDDLRSLVHKSHPGPILKQRWLYIIDSGGQPEFHNMLSVFVQNTSACIFVFRMHDKLDECPSVYFYKHGSPIGPTCHSRLTNKQIFQQFMRTMQSFNSMKYEDSLRSLPSILLLATHRDLVDAGKLPELLEERHEQLKVILLPQFESQLIYCDEQLEEFIFTMNAKQPEDRDIETAEVIQECITNEEKCPWVEKKIPLRWHALDHRSRKLSDHLKRKVLSREEYGKIAKSLGIKKDSCEAALKFFNSLNTIFYFPKALPDVVFLDPQILLDVLSKLVAKKCQRDKYNRAIKAKEDDIQFHKFAQVTEELLHEFAEHYHPPLFTSKELIILFEKLLLFGKLGKGNLEEGKLGKEKWFVPSILPYLKEEEIEKHRQTEKRALVIYFPDGGPQNGLFCSTASFLLSSDNTSPSPWEVLKDCCGKPKCLKSNGISFTVEKIPGEVILIEKLKHFEVHVESNYEGHLWELVYTAVFNGLKKAAETHHYTYTDDKCPQPAIICPEQHKPTPHPATDDKGPQPTIICPKQHKSIPHPATINYKEGTWSWRCTQFQECGDQIPSGTGTIPWLTCDQLHVIPGSPVKFTVTANTDFGTLTYKWQRNGADLDSLPEGVPGETTSTLQIDNVKKHHEGTYTCIVSNEVGATPQKPVSNTTSSPAQLTVLDAPQINEHPDDQHDMVPGSTVKFTITATGGADLAYKWQKIGADLDSLPGGVSGETTDTLRIDKVKKSHEGTYTCIVSNAAGSTPSNPAQLTVLDPLQIAQHPTPQLDVVPGSTAKFTIIATGGGTLTYKWQWDGADLDPLPEGVSGETTSTLQIDNVKKKHKGTYTCTVSNAAGPTPSNSAQLTVCHSWRMRLLIAGGTFGGIFALVLVLLGIGTWCGLLDSEVPHLPGNVRSPFKYDAPPTLDVLRYFPVKDGHIDIAEEIGPDYEKFGTEDKTGNKVKNIKISEREDPLLVTVQILRQWLIGKGKEPVTWQTLLNNLRATGLNVLAKNIDHSLSKHNENKETKNLDRDPSEL